MALRPCRECKREVSTDATVCPHCGKRYPARWAGLSPGAGCLVLLIVLFIGGTIVSGPSVNAPRAVVDAPDPKALALSHVKLDYAWDKDTLVNIMTATFTIRNQGKRRIKDLTIHCEHSGPSGTIMDSNERVIYETIPAGKTKIVRNFNMGFIASQAVRTNCRVIDLVVE